DYYCHVYDSGANVLF
nr:immunoglobulin light chain junction region [Macaca mulatta]